MKKWPSCKDLRDNNPVLYKRFVVDLLVNMKLPPYYIIPHSPHAAYIRYMGAVEASVQT